MAEITSIAETAITLSAAEFSTVGEARLTEIGDMALAAAQTHCANSTWLREFTAGRTHMRDHESEATYACVMQRVLESAPEDGVALGYICDRALCAGNNATIQAGQDAQRKIEKIAQPAAATEAAYQPVQ